MDIYATSCVDTDVMPHPIRPHMNKQKKYESKRDQSR